MQDKAYPDKTRSAVTDPVCGMQVAADTDHRHTHVGTEYLFCSAACHDKFVAAPGKYLHAEPKGSAVDTGTTDYCPDDTCSIGSVSYTCPMHPEIRLQGPGACPKCGMALEPVSEPLEHTYGIHLPHASGGRAGPPGQLSEMRHDAGSPDRRGARRHQ